MWVRLLGVISGRLLMPLVLRRLRPETLLPASLALALGGILAFILVPGAVAKAALCAMYGLGVGPVFPLLVGALAGRVGIARSYWFCAAAAAGLLAGGDGDAGNPQDDALVVRPGAGAVVAGVGFAGFGG